MLNTVDRATLRCGNRQSNHHCQRMSIQLLTGRMPFLPSNQQCQGTESNNSIYNNENKYTYVHIYKTLVEDTLMVSK